MNLEQKCGICVWAFVIIIIFALYFGKAESQDCVPKGSYSVQKEEKVDLNFLTHVQHHITELHFYSTITTLRNDIYLVEGLVDGYLPNVHVYLINNEKLLIKDKEYRILRVSK